MRRVPRALTFCLLHVQFKRGRTNLTNDLCEGCPSAATTGDNISSVRHMIEIDKRVTYQQIRTIDMSRAHNILHKDLAVTKPYTQLMPHNLIEAQKLPCLNRCREMMQIFASGDASAAHDMVTSDES
ncbi:hypothetical protein EVAR_2625_1 [Eumeta japonica]|uniref:Uncharacterized protein n=1 Tax=Eumeta variegata TaxID=151549 RepID=A0A4C1SMN9_EUMVA|nr:hypothetical protein EVAR_2625_1 [Eumeta japonica]